MSTRQRTVRAPIARPGITLRTPTVAWGLAILLTLVLVIALITVPTARVVSTKRGATSAVVVTTVRHIPKLTNGRAMLLGICAVGLLGLCSVAITELRRRDLERGRLNRRVRELERELAQVTEDTGGERRRLLTPPSAPARAPDRDTASDMRRLVLGYIQAMDTTRDEAIVAQLTLALQRAGVERIAPAPGDPFDDARHRAVASLTTTDASRDDTIAALVRAGYADRRGMIREAEVQVYALDV